MNGSKRLSLIVLANFAMVAAMLYWLARSGIDIQHSTLAENADNLSFVFDFLSFLAFSFVVNISILAYPSKKQSTLSQVAAILQHRAQPKQPAKQHRQKIA